MRRYYLHILIFPLFVFFASFSYSQFDIIQYVPVEEEIIPPTEGFPIFETRPEFPGGDVALLEFLSENLNYPESARELAIEGRVFVKFVVSREGKVVDVEIVRGLCDEINAECIRVVSSMPDWTPAKINRMPVSYSYMIPIKFSLLPDVNLDSGSFAQDEEESNEESVEEKHPAVKNDNSIEEEQEMLSFENESVSVFNPEIYPNPAEDYVMLSFSENPKDDVLLQVYNSLGNTVMQLPIESNEYRVDISDLPIGMYIFSITSGNKMKTIKLLKQ